MATVDELSSQIATYLTSQNLPPNPTWLQAFSSTIRLQTPLVSLQKTALFRILATDLTLSIDTSHAVTDRSRVQYLPNDISSPQTRERRLQGSITVQVLDVQDIGRSRWSQFEALEARDRGETTKGREIIRVVPEEPSGEAGGAGTGAEGQISSSGPHKLLLQDAFGTKVFGFELESVKGVGVQMGIGAKLLLTDCVVARGVILLRPATVQVLGGKVEVWDKKWKADLKENLKAMAGTSGEERG